MAQRYFKYKVTDKATGNIILKDVDAKEVGDTIGINVINISSYALQGLAYKRRYIIERKEIKKEEKRDYTPSEKLWMKEWDKVRFLLNPKARKDNEKTTQEI